MRKDWGFSELARIATAPPIIVRVAEREVRKSRGCLATVGFFVVAFALYCLMRF